MNLTLIIHISKCIRNKKVLLQGHLVDISPHMYIYRDYGLYMYMDACLKVLLHAKNLVCTMNSTLNLTSIQ